MCVDCPTDRVQMEWGLSGADIPLFLISVWRALLSSPHHDKLRPEAVSPHKCIL